MDICLDKRIILNRYLYVIFKIHDSDMLIFSCAYTCCTLIPNTPPLFGVCSSICFYHERDFRLLQ